METITEPTTSTSKGDMPVIVDKNLWNDSSDNLMSRMEESFSDEKLASIPTADTGIPATTKPEGDTSSGDSGTPIQAQPEQQIQPEQQQIQPTGEEVDDQIETFKKTKPINLSTRNSQNWDNLVGALAEAKKELKAFKAGGFDPSKESEHQELARLAMDRYIDSKNKIKEVEDKYKRLEMAYQYKTNPQSVPAVPEIDGKRQDIYDEILDIIKINLPNTPEEELAHLRNTPLDKVVSAYSNNRDSWNEQIFDKIDEDEGKRIKDRFIQLKELDYQKLKTIQNSVKDIEKFQKEGVEQQAKQKEEYDNGLRDAIMSIRQSIPEANPKQVPKGATKEQIDEINRWNQRVQYAEQVAEKALNPKTPREHAETAAAATWAITMAIPMIADLEKQLEAERTKNTKIQAVSKTSTAGASTPTKKAESSISELMGMTPEQRFERYQQEKR